MKIRFDKVGVKGRKSGKCVTCGKRRSRTREFWQTLNPFNKTEDGQIKSRDQILAETRVKLMEWREKPIDCCGRH